MVVIKSSVCVCGCALVCGAICQAAHAAVFVVSCGGGQWDGSKEHQSISYSIKA